MASARMPEGETPKRIIDGEALWSSQKIGRLEPEWVRAEYANLLPLATANGTFELDARLIYARVYVTNRPSMTPKKVSLILQELERVKLLFPFEAEGKRWGYWVGADKPGRLPSAARRGIHERTGPEVPREQLQCFLTDADGIQTDTNVPKPKPKPEPKARNFPEPFEVSGSAQELAKELGVDLAEQLAAFADYHRSKGSRFVNWNLALHTWLRNSVRFGGRNGGKTKGERQWDEQRRNVERAKEILAARVRGEPGGTG